MAVSLKLDETLKQDVTDLAALKDRSPHWIMCKAIKDYVDRERARESFKAEALQAWADYKETGLHLSGEEALEWLSQWGTDKETSAPKCHG